MCGMLICFSTRAQEQKPAIGISGPEKWSSIGFESTVISDDGKHIMYAIEENGNTGITQKALIVKSIASDWQKRYEDVNAFSFKFSPDGRYAFFKKSDGKKYRVDLNSRKEEIYSARDDDNLLIQEATEEYVFSKKAEALPSPDPNLARVDVWGYEDANYANPWRKRKDVLEYDYVTNRSTGKGFQLTHKNEQIVQIKGEWAIISYCEGGDSPTEKFWNDKARVKYYLTSLIDGTRTFIMREPKSEGTTYIQFSPGTGYIVIPDNANLSYSCFNIKTKRLYDISKGKKITRRGAGHMDVEILPMDFTFLSDSTLLSGDEYDLWKLDLRGDVAPVNLTNGYGRANKIAFRTQKVKIKTGERKLHREVNGYIINAFDTKNKSWGFYSLKNLNGSNPIELSMGPYYYGGESNPILKAEGSDVYIVKRETAKESPNLFATRDFKAFKRLTDVKPEKEYNWLTSELVHWTDLNGKGCDGILYKPENFNPNLRYPVVTVIYDGFSQFLNRFPFYNVNSLGHGNFLPVTWLASNGYLVFVPDITLRRPGKVLIDTYNTLIPGVNRIKSFPFVSEKKIGLQGASWGGMQTNYIVTQSDIFAAAHSAAAYSEYISSTGYSSEISPDYNMPGKGESFGGLITEVPENYVSQSALFLAEKVTTPLLIRHNRQDPLPFYQSLQYFRLLRRLGKKAWLLQYDDSEHGLQKGKSMTDCYLRISQFFDHYLKDKPAPKWMTQGILPDLKQVDSGLELDPGVEP